MTETDIHQRFREDLKQYFACRDVFLVSKGRIALYAALRASGVGPGDEVLLPGYTCVVVPAMIQRVGATPVYVDVDASTYNISLASLKERITPRSRALLVQHTYGIPCGMDSLLSFAEAHNLLCLEDCCHALGSTYQKRLCGTFGAAAFLSGQWNKPFSTGLGGMLVVNDSTLGERVESVLQNEFHQPGPGKEILLKLQQILYSTFVTPKTVMSITDLYRFASKYGLMIGSSSTGELEGRDEPGDHCTMAACQARMGVRGMKTIQSTIAHRTHIAAFYRSELNAFDQHRLPDSLVEETVYLRYPLRVRNKPALIEHAKKHRIETGTWFESPLHPLHRAWERFSYHPGMCPVGETLSAQTINLPTHPGITPAEAESIVSFIRQYAEPV